MAQEPKTSVETADCVVVWDLTKLKDIERLSPIGILVTKEGFKQTLIQRWAKALGKVGNKTIRKISDKKYEIRQRIGWWQYHSAIYDYYIWYLRVRKHFDKYKERVKKWSALSPLL